MWPIDSEAELIVKKQGDIFLVLMNRPGFRNSVNQPQAAALSEAFQEFENDPCLKVAVLGGIGGHFCAGADLNAWANDTDALQRLSAQGDGPLGPTRMQMSKPVVAAIEGCCVAGGLELAAWCDLRVAAETAYFGVLCRRFGVPLVDGGTVRLPRLIGMSHALDMILTGRSVSCEEAWRMGLINRRVAAGQAWQVALELAEQLCRFPQHCLRNDRASVYQQWNGSIEEGMRQEFSLGLRTIASGETEQGALKFKGGLGRHGRSLDNPAD